MSIREIFGATLAVSLSLAFAAAADAGGREASILGKAGLGKAGIRASLPVVLASASPAFDRACVNYYQQGNDPDVTADVAQEFCGCIAGNMEAQGLGREVLAFLARTYSEDLTAFIDDYPNGEAWMEAFFASDEQCKNADYGSNLPPDEQEPNPPADGLPAGSWGGIVREGPGQNYRKLASLQQGEHVTLLENTSVYQNGFPWWYIEYWGGRKGYQWGGILCSLNAPMEGIYESCY